MDDDVMDIVVDNIQSLEVVGDCVLITYTLTDGGGENVPVLRMLWRGSNAVRLPTTSRSKACQN